MINKKDFKICVIGLGYVGLPLAVAFGKKFSTLGYDLDIKRVADLKNGYDATLEIDRKQLSNSKFLSYTNNLDDIKKQNFYIVSVPTPIDSNYQPDLDPIKSASRTIGSILKDGDFVVFESTVYPGASEEVCIPILEKVSGLKLNKNFYVGYSPERINPGDKKHRIENIVKVTSGSNAYAAEIINQVYSEIIEAGTFLAESIKVAEAAKVIENTQRDLNIALINELSIIFNKLDIDTDAVLKAAGTKWNFLNFKPGLVGGHCIGVDPYYLTHKAQAVGYFPEVILAGRRLNDNLPKHVVGIFIKSLIKKEIPILKSKVLIMGFTFKENCPDFRNTKVTDIVHELKSYGIEVDIFDPWIDKEKFNASFEYSLIPNPKKRSYDGIIITVQHQSFIDLGISEIKKYGKKKSVLFDVKSTFKKEDVDLRL